MNLDWGNIWACFLKDSGRRTSRTFTFHLRLAVLFVLLFRDPHLLKGSQRCQNRTADPRTEPTLVGIAGANNFYLLLRINNFNILYLVGDPIYRIYLWGFGG